MIRSVSKIAIVGVLLTSVSGVFAAEENHTGKVLSLWSDTARYGRCIVQIEGHIPGINCPANWVSLDCAGDFYSKEDGRRMWDSAQMAYALNQDVSVTIADTQKHNGYCVASRLTVSK